MAQELREYRCTVMLRIAAEEPDPKYWDLTELLDLNTGQGEQAWLLDSTLRRSGTEEQLEAGTGVEA